MKTITLSLLITLMGFGALAQTAGNMGDNPAKCKEYLSLYTRYLADEKFEMAYPHWINAVNTCPDYKVSLYTHGVYMMNELRTKETSKERKKVLADSIIWAYEENIKRFGNTLELSQNYGEDLIKFGRTGKGVEMLSMVLDSTKALNPSAIYYYSFGLKRLKAKDIKDCDVIVEEYDKLADVIEKNKANEDFEGSQAIVDRNLGPCLTCDKLIPVIKKNKFEDAKTDDDLRKSVIEGLERRGCTDNDVYEALLKIEIDKNPTALGFIRLAQGFVKKGNKAKAKEYYFKAVEIAETDEDKIAYLLECASAVPASAGECMGKIAKINPNSGAPILYKARKIGSSRCGTSAFEDAAINWAAYDMAAKAKSTDPSVAAEASRLMSAYKSRFPDDAAKFAQGLANGQSYTTCNGYKTTVK